MTRATHITNKVHIAS